MHSAADSRRGVAQQRGKATSNFHSGFVLASSGLPFPPKVSVCCACLQHNLNEQAQKVEEPL